MNRGIDGMRTSEFIAFLAEEYGLTGIERSKLEYMERKKLLSPARLDNKYRIYTEAEAAVVLKVTILNQFLGIVYTDIQRIEGIKTKPARDSVIKEGPAFFYERLLNTDEGELHRGLNNIAKGKMIKARILEAYHQNGDNAADSYSKIDWCGLYTDSAAIRPMKASVDQDKLDQMVQHIIDNLDLEQIIEEVREELKDELGDSARDEIMDRYELEDFDEEDEDNDPAHVEAFHIELEEWIEQYEEEAVLEMMERQLDEEIQSRLQKNQQDDILLLSPALKAEIKSKFNQAYQKSRESNVSKLQFSYDAKHLVLGVNELEVLSIILFGEYRWNYYLELVEAVPGVLDYVKANYAAIRQCTRELKETYGESMEHGFFAVYSIPERDKTVLEAAERCGVKLLNNTTV